MNNEAYKHHFITMATQFFSITEYATSALIYFKNPAQGNIFKAIDNKTSPDEKNNLSLGLSCADHEIGIAILFNFYHAIELTIKGLIELKTGKTPNGHKLTSLIEQLDKSYPKEKEFIEVIDRFIREIPEDSLLREYLTLNECTIDKWYEFFKYPKSNKNNKDEGPKNYDFSALHNKGKDGICFWFPIHEASKSIAVDAYNVLANLYLENSAKADNKLLADNKRCDKPENRTKLFESFKDLHR